MNTKMLAFVLCGVLVGIIVFSSYYFGASSNYAKGFNDGNSTGYEAGYNEGHKTVDNFALNKFLQGNQTGFDQGYQVGYDAGLQDGMNGTG